ncbi:MAG: GTP-sensing pleiotropic transcriptional regulator CodY [bacterium]
MQALLERIRGVSKLILHPQEGQVDFVGLAGVLSETLEANIYIVDVAGNLLGYALAKSYECDKMNVLLQEETKVPEQFIHALLDIEETKANIKESHEHCVFDSAVRCPFEVQISTYIPIKNHGQRLGTLVLTNFTKDFTEADLVLGEYCTTLVGMEMMRLRIERAEENERQKTAVQVVLKTVSYSELIAIEAVMQEMNGDEGVITAAKVADQGGITRSVIVNALRKLESAGIINSRSLGMKGTYIKILNSEFLPMLEEAVR